MIRLICGIDEINIAELEKSIEYDGCDKNNQTVKWFWEIVKEFNEEHKKLLLKFVTGSERTPLKGVSDLNMAIMVQGLDDERLPSAHTCFNHLVLPTYSSKEVMKKKLLQALEHHEGFGLI